MKFKAISSYPQYQVCPGVSFEKGGLGGIYTL